MGTRATISIRNEDEHLVSFYFQFDGYPSGVGMDLHDFLKDIKLVNGIRGNDAFGTHANGVGCLAAQMIKHFKDDIGGFYIIPESQAEGQDYHYDVIFHTEGSGWNAAEALKAISVNGQAFYSLTDFGAYCKQN